MKKITFILILIFVLGLGVGYYFLFMEGPIHTDTNISFWIWHSNADVTRKQHKILKKINVKELFIRTGEFDINRGKIFFRNDQINLKNKYLNQYELTLVYTFSVEFKKNFALFNNEEMLKTVAGLINKNIRFYIKHKFYI